MLNTKEGNNLNILLDKDGRIKATSLEGYPVPEKGESTVKLDLPEDFGIGRQGDYRVVKGAIIYDPLPVVATEPTPDSVSELRALITELRAFVAQQDEALVELAGMIAGGGA